MVNEVPGDDKPDEELTKIREERDALLGEKEALKEEIESVSASVSEKDEKIASLTEENAALSTQTETLSGSVKNYRNYAFILVGLAAILAIVLAALLLIRPPKNKA